MIYTLTLNPSLDYIAKADSLEIGKTNRTYDEYLVPGGKGINVSIMLKRMGVQTTAFGFTAGFTGEKLKSMLQDLSVPCDFCETESGFTRINVKLVSNTVTEFNGSGITINQKDLDNLKNKISNIKDGWLILSGNIPNGVPNKVYADIIASVNENVKVVLDSSGEALKEGISKKPFLIKPNISELSELLGEEPKKENLKNYAERLMGLGAQNVIISLDSGGAVMLDQTGDYHEVKVPDGEFVNSVGAGDSLIAGFIYEYEKTKDFYESLKYGVASGSATAYSKWLSEKEFIDKLYKEI